MAVLVVVAAGFKAFTAEHDLLLALLLLGALTVGVLGAQQRDRDREERFRRVAALLIPFFTVPFQLLQLLPGDFTLGTSLPLQICDLSWMVAVYALWTRSARAISLLYLWGLTLTVQAAVTPSLGQAFPDPRYFMFWGMHFLTIWAAVYLVCLVGGPTWAGYRFTVLCTAAWAALVSAFNAIAGTNYGYLAHKPSTASLLDLFGPWPAYVVVEVVVLLAGWALMTWPWVRVGRTVGEGSSTGGRSTLHGHRRPLPPDRSARRAAPADLHEHRAGEDGTESGGGQQR